MLQHSHQCQRESFHQAICCRYCSIHQALLLCEPLSSSFVRKSIWDGSSKAYAGCNVQQVQLSNGQRLQFCANKLWPKTSIQVTENSHHGDACCDCVSDPDDGQLHVLNPCAKWHIPATCTRQHVLSCSHNTLRQTRNSCMVCQVLTTCSAA